MDDTPEDLEEAAFQYGVNELRYQVQQGILGTKDDGDGSHGEPVIPLTYDKSADIVNETAGRCLIDGRPWDDHLGLMPQVGAFQCKGLYVTYGGNREE